MKLFLFNNDEKLIGTVSPLEGIQNEEINKIQTIECTTVYSELIEKASYIGHKDYSDNRIFHLYKIDHVTKTSTTDVRIVGVHTFFDDMESDGYIKDFRPTNREVVGVLTTILDGSRWQLGSVNVQRNYTGNFYYVTRKEAISKLIEATQIEIKPRLEFSRGKITGRYLDVFSRLGGRNGKVFVHGRDLLTVSEKKSQGAIYTAVVGRGKGEETDTGGYGRRITFKDVVWTKSRGNAVDKPAGQEYVEIPAMTELYGFEKGTKPRIKIVEFQDETDKEKLLRLSYEWLEKNSRMQVEYSAKVLNVGNLELGDTVGIFNPKLGIKYETRVFKVKRNLVNNKLTEFGIGDKVTTSPFSRTIELAKEMKNFQDDTVYWLDKIRERLSDKLINEDGYNYDLKADNEYKVPAGYYSFDKPIDQNPTKVVYMGAGKIAIADSKKPTGEWNWKTFLDGTGATLDLINTGVLRAGRIQSADGSSYWDLDSGEFHLEQSAVTEVVKTVVDGKVQEIVGEVKKNLPTKEELKGKNSYLHKKYSDYSDGRNMSDNSTLKYIGIYTGEKEQAPTNASEYSWTKIRGEDGNNGRDGVDGKSYARNYLSETAEEKTLTLNNNSYVTQEIFKLVENKTFRDLGFKVGDKVTFVADYEILPNGNEKRINRLNFEWHDDTRFRVLMNFENNPTKGTYVATLTMNNDLLDCKRAIFRADNVNAKIKITNARLIQGDTVQPWSIAQEDLRGHTLTANMWFSGNYSNNTTNRVFLNLIVYYDGKEVKDYNVKVSYKGGGINNWRFQENAIVSRDNIINHDFWNDGEKDGTPLFALATVTYKGLQIVSDARLDNVPNVEEVKETIKRFKTFESTLEGFKSVIGEIKAKEIKAIVKAPNLCTEDFSNRKQGNDLYFNVSPNLKANTKYTIIVRAITVDFNAHQKTKVYGAKSGGGEQWLKSGYNVWVVDYATEQTRVNIYPLGNSSQVTKVEIYEGDYKEYIDKNNKFTSLGEITNKISYYTYKINHNIAVAKGKFYLVRFDLATLPTDKWFSAGDGGTLLEYEWDFKKFNEELKLKDNEYIFEAHYDEDFYIFHSTNSLKITNVRLYEVRFGVTLATQSSLVDISSMIDQSKDSIILSTKSEINDRLRNYPSHDYLNSNFANKRDIENLASKSELKILTNKIESTVTTGNIGTLLSQNAEEIIVAWNNYNKYFSFNNETLDIYENAAYQQRYKKLSLTSEGLKIYNNNTLIGTIGTFTHLGQSFRQNTLDIVLTENTKAFGIYTWSDTWAFDTHLVGYAPLFEIKLDNNGTYRSYFHQPVQTSTAYIGGLYVAESGTSYIGGVTKTINVGGRNLRFVQGILVSG